MKPMRILLTLAILVLAAGGAWSGYNTLQRWRAGDEKETPSTKVRRGEVIFTVTSKGAFQGGNSKMLVAPMTGGNQLTLMELRKPGEMVNESDIVARFDTTEETFKLREAEADLAEAEQQVIQAESEAAAKEEELNYELIQARGDLTQAELECRRNELKSRIEARQNELTLADAKDKLAKLERDYPSRKAAATASIAIQAAAKTKATMLADTARRNIEMMTLKAPTGGYVNIEKNTNSNFFFPGMQFPTFQVGDQVRAGMAVAQIPDLASWEVTAEISELDRGHLEVGQMAAISATALPGEKFIGKIVNLGGTTGPPWNRRFECKLSLTDPRPALRPGMSASIVITTQTLKDVLWIPAQALFESDGRSYVYLASAKGFTAKDVKMVRRSESQVVIEGLQENEMVALASPDQQSQSAGASKGSKGGAAKAIAK